MINHDTRRNRNLLDLLSDYEIFGVVISSLIIDLVLT